MNQQIKKWYWRILLVLWLPAFLFLIVLRSLNGKYMVEYNYVWIKFILIFTILLFLPASLSVKKEIIKSNSLFWLWIIIFSIVLIGGLVFLFL
jgi:hypothetical protein